MLTGAQIRAILVAEGPQTCVRVRNGVLYTSPDTKEWKRQGMVHDVRIAWMVIEGYFAEVDPERMACDCPSCAGVLDALLDIVTETAEEMTAKQHGKRIMTH